MGLMAEAGAGAGERRYLPCVDSGVLGRAGVDDYRDIPDQLGHGPQALREAWGAGKGPAASVLPWMAGRGRPQAQLLAATSGVTRSFCLL